MVENSPPSLQKLDAAALGGRHFRYYDYIVAAFVTVLLLSNVLGAGKRAVVDLPWIGEWPFGAGILFRSVAHTYELQSLMRISFAVLCLKTKKLFHGLTYRPTE